MLVSDTTMAQVHRVHEVQKFQQAQIGIKKKIDRKHLWILFTFLNRECCPPEYHYSTMKALKKIMAHFYVPGKDVHNYFNSDHWYK